MPETDPAETDIDLVKGLFVVPEFFDRLYARHCTAVFSLALRITQNPSLAEEATQDVFLQAWRTIQSFDSDRGTVRTWLLMMARARALDRLRSAQTTGGRMASLGSFDPNLLPARSSSVERDLGLSQEVAAMNALLAVLPDSDRGLIELAYYKELSQGEISVRLGEPLGTVKTRMRRVLRLLRHATADDQHSPFTWTVSRASSGAVAPPLLDKLTVLAVDDDPDTLTLVTLVLKRAGAVVIPASSALQARRRLQTTWPDIVLADLDMPGEGGCELLHYVRSVPDCGSRVPAAAFTAHGNEADRFRTAEAGFNAHLLKPIQPSLLVSQVATLARLQVADNVAS